MGSGLLGGCKLEELFSKPGDELDVDDDGLRRFPWGPDFDDDDDGALQFVAGGTDYDDTDEDVQRNDGNGTFAAPAFFPTGFGPSGLALADFDADGNLDLVTSNQNDFTATVWFGAGDGTFTAPGTIPVANNTGASAVVAGDFDEDDRLDIVVGTGNLLFLNAGSRTFNAPVALNFDGIRNVVRDLDGDGHLDVVGVKDLDGVTAVLGNGDGTFSDPIDSGTGVRSRALAVADFDGDGVLDAAVVTFEGGSNQSELSVLPGDNDGSFRAPLTTTLPAQESEIAAADLNGDGEVDAVVTDSVAGRLRVLLGDGTGHFGAPQTYNVSGAGRVLIADLDGDAVRDLAVASQTAGLLRAFGEGDGTFGTFTATGAGSAFEVAAGNLDGDGRLDLVAINLAGSTAAVQRGN
jgi:hypothetical protein